MQTNKVHTHKHTHSFCLSGPGM